MGKVCSCVRTGRDHRHRGRWRRRLGEAGAHVRGQRRPFCMWVLMGFPSVFGFLGFVWGTSRAELVVQRRDGVTDRNKARRPHCTPNPKLSRSGESEEKWVHLYVKPPVAPRRYGPFTPPWTFDALTSNPVRLAARAHASSLWNKTLSSTWTLVFL
jgi:hypothetical protein